MKEKLWYEADNVSEFDSPALFIYPNRIKANISRLTERADPQNLRPHVKTNKIAEVTRMMLQAGIRKFKSATIAETEMLAMINASDVLLAYPPTIQKIKRLIRLTQKYPDTIFSFLVDHADTAKTISDMFTDADLTAYVYIDLNVGMNRTGIIPGNAEELYHIIMSLPNINILGLHAYDGHIRDKDIQIRTENCQRAFKQVLVLKTALEKLSAHPLTLIAGGTPTCFIHAAEGDREVSPGTFIFCDKGYSEQLPEQPFEWAATLVCRIVSIPAPDLICVDLGYKSVASENPLPRVFFLNAPQAIPTAHSEEHLVLKVADSGKFKPGDILYGIPWHICPTVALYEKVYIVENNHVTGFWKVIARNREISV
ncbi:MAG: D-TA family PLP-dependent enzyme [Bacteroidota bacterium]|nr:D-TA family PLP-dependent enzyme [Bacteroidota bacterium]